MDHRKIVVPTRRQMRPKAFQNAGRVFALEHTAKKEPVVISSCDLGRRCVCIAVGMGHGPFKVKHTTKVLEPQATHGLDRCAVRHEDVMHRTRCCPDVAQAQRMSPFKMRQPTHTPRFINRGD